MPAAPAMSSTASRARRGRSSTSTTRTSRSEEHTSELQSHSDLHSFPTRRSSDLDLGWKLIVNACSTGYVFDGEPSASWAIVDVNDEDVTAEIRRTEFDALAVSNALSARGLPGD